MFPDHQPLLCTRNKGFETHYPKNFIWSFDKLLDLHLWVRVKTGSRGVGSRGLTPSPFPSNLPRPMINIICSRSHFVINTVRALPLPPLKHICLFGCPSHRWWQDLVPDSLHRALSVFRALLAEALRFENVSFDRDVTNNSRCIECDTLRRVNRVNVRFSSTETSGGYCRLTSSHW